MIDDHSDSLNSLTQEEFDEELAKSEQTIDRSLMDHFFVPDSIMNAGDSRGEYQEVNNSNLLLELEGEEEDTEVDLNAFYQT